MHRHLGHRHSIYCILPPHLLRDIARTGTKEQRHAALEADITFRPCAGPSTAGPIWDARRGTRG